jgi:hypothetical protein
MSCAVSGDFENMSRKVANQDENLHTNLNQSEPIFPVTQIIVQHKLSISIGMPQIPLISPEYSSDIDV